MSVRVRFFAAAREAAGASEVEIEAAPGTTVSTLVRLLCERRGEALGAALTAPGIRVAVNQDLVEGDPRVDDGDEVAFLPPVTGG